MRALRTTTLPAAAAALAASSDRVVYTGTM
jgi:hypothetical protein